MARGYLTPSELKALFRQIKTPRDRALFAIGYAKGLRASELGLLLAEECNVSRVDPTLYVHRLKGSRSGRCELSPQEARLLRHWLKVRGRHDGPLFVSRKRQPISRQRVYALMAEYATRAKLAPELRQWKALKASLATHLMTRRAGVYEINRALGHKKIQNTMRYVGDVAQFGAVTRGTVSRLLSEVL